MDQTKNFWLDLFTWETWNKFLKAGVTSLDFVSQVGRRCKKLNVAISFFVILQGSPVSVGALEVLGQPFLDKSPIWHSDAFPARLHVNV
jgi:hypothetical protein